MKDLFRVLRQEELDIERVRKKIEALHFVIPLLAEEADWIENGLAPPRFRATKLPFHGNESLLFRMPGLFRAKNAVFLTACESIRFTVRSERHWQKLCTS
jgi:hypothetical protein